MKEPAKRTQKMGSIGLFNISRKDYRRYKKPWMNKPFKTAKTIKNS